MSNKRRVARNVVCNLGGIVAHLLSGFITAPLLIQNLGGSRYGLWILIASLTGYFGLLDLGLCGALSRNLAFHLARDDRERSNTTASTGLFLLGLVGIAVLLCTAGAQWLFFVLVDVPAEQVMDVSWAMWMVGLNLVVMVLAQVFASVLWAHQRFDVINAILAPTLVIRVGLIAWLIPQGYGLTMVASIILLGTILDSVGKMVAAFVIDPGLRLSPGRVTRSAMRDLWGYGVWYLLMSMEKPLVPQAVNLVIGNRLGSWFVTPFNVATRLIAYSNGAMMNGTQVLTPMATALYAGNQRNQQANLFLQGGKVCMGLALLFLTLFFFLGQPLIQLWIGDPMPGAWMVLVVLAVGELLPMSQWISHSTILGMGKHKLMAGVSIAEFVVTVVLALILIPMFGLLGGCIAIAIPAFLGRGLCQLIYACRLVEVPIGTYLVQTFLPALGVALPPACLLALLTWWHQPASWLELFLYGGGYGLAFLVGTLQLVGYRQAWELVWARAGGKLSGAQEDTPEQPEDPLGECVVGGDNASTTTEEDTKSPVCSADSATVIYTSQGGSHSDSRNESEEIASGAQK